MTSIKFADNEQRVGNHSFRVRDLPLDIIHIDERYQRALDERLVTRIAEEWDERKYQVISVNHRSGVYYCFDGQHRLEGARRAGITRLTAQVFDNLTAEEEAELFVALQLGRKRPTAVERYSANLFRREERTMEIETIIRANGCRVAIGSGNGIIAAVQAVEQVYNRYGADGLAATLAFIADTWGVDEPHALEGAMLQGTARFLSAFADQERVLSETAAKAARDTPTRIWRHAQYANREAGGGLPLNVARQLLAVYNKGRRNHLKAAL